jgi:hypothetical protein
MQKGWLAQAGPYKIEHVPCPDYAGDVDPSAPPKGVLHTTEGGWDGSMAVFRQHYAPHFVVGPGRIAQLLPLGRAAAALEHNGWPETNRVARVQIEIVGNSKRSTWLPDAKTVDALAWLMAELERVAGVPLAHVAPDRNASAWLRARGWCGHIDVPGNAHWDPGALNWPVLMQHAKARCDGAALRARKGFWAWLTWYLGEGDWKPYGPRNASARPNVPKRIPSGWWKHLQSFLAARK